MFINANVYLPNFEADRVHYSRLNDFCAWKNSPRHSDWSVIMTIGEITLALNIK